DVVVEALVIPAGQMPGEEARQRVADHAAHYFEDVWIHRPLRSLNHVPPIDAAGHATLSKKLRGVVQFLQECGSIGGRASYDFDRLRRKLGLAAGSPSPANSGAPAIEGMGAAELAGLKIELLNDEQLESAYQTAQKLDAREMAQNFARALVARPPRAEK